MAWLKLTTADGQTTLINSGHIVEVCENRSGSGAKSGARICAQGSLLGVRETVEEIAAMIEQAEWRELVRRLAVALLTRHGDNLLPHDVWGLAREMADAETKSGGQQ